MIKLRGCLVLKFRINHSVALADQAEPKNGFRPYGLRVPWVSAGKIQKGIVLIFFFFCGFILMFKTKISSLMSL